jgi:hypothetical protein
MYVKSAVKLPLRLNRASVSGLPLGENLRRKGKMRAKDKLRAFWSKKENDLIFWLPMGQRTKCDANWLNGIFTKDFQKELTDRGYDFTTFKFEISPQKGNERFVSQRKG